MERASGPARRTTPMPPRPGGVEMATMVSSRCTRQFQVSSCKLQEGGAEKTRRRFTRRARSRRYSAKRGAAGKKPAL